MFILGALSVLFLLALMYLSYHLGKKSINKVHEIKIEAKPEKKPEEKQKEIEQEVEKLLGYNYTTALRKVSTHV